jgi:glucose/arabinose dehydrogenase
MNNILLAILLLFSLPTLSQPIISYQTLLKNYNGQLSEPTDIANAKDGSNRLFITEKGGRIKIFHEGAVLPTPFLDLSGVISTEGDRGLLSLAFHPSYATNGYFFVYYTDKENGAITLARYQVSSSNKNIADASTGIVLLSIPKPVGSDGVTTFKDHNGGDLNFGPDGHLYFGVGDGGKETVGDPYNNGQNGAVLLGKMIRINVDNLTTAPYYTIPSSNPYVNDPAVRDEIWAVGMRNPWRWSFDRTTGDMWIGDVGHVLLEEINFVKAGSTGGLNFGWRCYEGTTPYNDAGCGSAGNYTMPIYEYLNPESGPASITGGYVYRGSEYPFLKGYYISADMYSGKVYLLKSNGAGGWNSTVQNSATTFIVSFGEGENGDIYALSYFGGLFKVTATAPATLPVTLTQFEAKKHAGFVALEWTTSTEQNTKQFLVEYSTDGSSFKTVGQVKASGYPTGSIYRYQHYTALNQTAYYRLAMEDEDKSVRYSTVIKVVPDKEKKLAIYPTVSEGKELQVILPEAGVRLQILNAAGEMVFEKNLSGAVGKTLVALPSLAKGTYFV